MATMETKQKNSSGITKVVPVTRGQRFEYILRCPLEPGFYEEVKVSNLIKYCKEAGIDDVTFIINGEDLNLGHITEKEAWVWLEMISRVEKKLAKLGITISINPWETLLHADRGRVLRADQNFQLMVDHRGRKTQATVCPLCPQWHKHLQKIWSCYASIKPNMIWIEDDFRFHNHAPLEWGGCFCDLHMQEFSKVIGKKVSREEFFNGIVKLGKPHPFRKAWLDVNRQTMNELAHLIAKAVHEVSPSTNVALMSSCPNIHCAEGRDWGKILDGLSDGSLKIVRPHLPCYVEDSSHRYLWNFAGVGPYTQAFAGADSQLYPEIENTSSCSHFSKSNRFVRFQIILALTMGIKGITLNVFESNGNGPFHNDGQRKTLLSNKAFFGRVASLGINLNNQKGIKVLVNSKASESIQTRYGTGMAELYPVEVFWAQLLTCFGISNVIKEEPEPKGEIVAFSGQYLRGISKEKIRELFEYNRVIMDGEATETLYKLGLGELAGVESVQVVDMNNKTVSYEQVCDENSYCGISEARLSSSPRNGGTEIYLINYAKPVDVRTVLKSPSGQVLGNGLTVCDERVIILPYGHPCSVLDSSLNQYLPTFPVTILNPVRKDLLETILLEIAKEKDDLTFTVGAPYLAVYRYDFADKVTLIVINATLDEVECVRLYLGDQKFKAGIIIDSRTNKEKIFEPSSKDGFYEIGALGDLEAKLVVLQK